jgi:hypothetical protein
MLNNKKAQIGTTLNWGAALILIFLILICFFSLSMLIVSKSNLFEFLAPQKKVLNLQSSYLELKTDISLIELNKIRSLNQKDFIDYKNKIKNLLKQNEN